MDTASPISDIAPAPSLPAWRLPTRIAFRFFALYFFMYVLMTQMLGGLLPFLNSNVIGNLLDPLILWTGDHVFHVVAKPVVSGSGDKMYDWMQAFCLLVIAASGTIVWSILDRRRQRYDRLYRWFVVFLRFALGSTMIGYGFSKAFPLQMPAPQLTRLLEPYGNFSPMGVLWYSIGASFAYERFVGIVEVVGGALMFFPRTHLAGTLVLLGATFEVFMLNMTYDVPVKLFSFHLFVMSLVLVAPFAKALCRVSFATRSKSWWAEAVQVLAGIYLLWTTAHGVMQGIGTFGYMAPKPPLYGIWTVEKMKIDGVERSPLLTDYDRWRRVIVQNAASMQFWRMDDTVMTLGKKLDEATRTITLTRGKDTAGTLTYVQPSPELMVFDGTIDKHAIHMETRLFDHNKMLLKTRGFNWVQEFPFNR
jgi:hypothetical protein